MGKDEEAQEGQFNLECLSLVYPLLLLKRPSQLELSDFCHFDLFLFFCCNVYFNSHPPACLCAAAASAAAAGGEVQVSLSLGEAPAERC